MPRKKNASRSPGSIDNTETLHFPMMNLDGSRPEPTSGGPGTVSQDEAEAGRLRVGVNLHAVEANGEDFISLARDAICCPVCDDPFKTGKNSSGNDRLMCTGIELYGVLLGADAV